MRKFPSTLDGYPRIFIGHGGGGALLPVFCRSSDLEETHDLIPEIRRFSPPVICVAVSSSFAKWPLNPAYSTRGRRFASRRDRGVVETKGRKGEGGVNVTAKLNDDVNRMLRRDIGPADLFPRSFYPCTSQSSPQVTVKPLRRRLTPAPDPSRNIAQRPRNDRWSPFVSVKLNRFRYSTRFRVLVKDDA